MIEQILSIIIPAILSYLIGSINGAKIVGKLKGIDFSEVGSGNIGATNVLRTLGLKWAFPTLLFDALKSSVVALISIKYGYNPYLTSGYVVIGHMYPIFNNFKGGKGVSTLLGAMVVLNPVLAFITLSIYLLLYYFTGIVSLSVLSSSILSYIGVLLFSNDMGLVLFTLCSCLLLLWNHEDNILRLLNGKEPKTKLFGNKKGES